SSSGSTQPVQLLANPHLKHERPSEPSVRIEYGGGPAKPCAIVCVCMCVCVYTGVMAAPHTWWTCSAMALPLFGNFLANATTRGRPNGSAENSLCVCV